MQREVLNEIHQHEVLTTVTYAQSIDGSISSRDSRPILLSGSASMTFTHELRAIHDGILVGINTILSDNPSLTVRLVKDAVNPTVIVVDTSLKCPIDRKILRGSPIFLSGPAETQDSGAYLSILMLIDDFTHQ